MSLELSVRTHCMIDAEPEAGSINDIRANDAELVAKIAPPSAGLFNEICGTRGTARAATIETLSLYFPEIVSAIESVSEQGQEKRMLENITHNALKSGMYFTQLYDLAIKLPRSAYAAIVAEFDQDAWREYCWGIAKAKMLPENCNPLGLYIDAKISLDSQGRTVCNVQSTIENVETFVQLCDMDFRYNENLKRQECSKNGGAWAELEDDQMAKLKSKMQKCSVHPLMVYDARNDFISAICREHEVKPFAEMQARGYERWLAAGKPDMLTALAETLTVDDADIRWRNAVIRRFMIAGVHINQVPTDAPETTQRMVLTLAGAQNMGKSRWTSRLVGDMHDYYGGGRQLDPHNKDSVKIAVSKAVTELGEVDGIVRKADVGALKNFVSAGFDEMRLPFARRPVKLRRRTLFVATVNERHFLRDETGNTRFVIIKCKEINHSHNLDMELVWGHAFSLWKEGETPYMSREEIDELLERSKEHMLTNEYETLLQSHFDCESEQRDNLMTPYEIWAIFSPSEASGKAVTDRATARDIDSAIRRVLGIELTATTRTTDGDRQKGRYYKMPPLRRPDSMHRVDAINGLTIPK